MLYVIAQTFPLTKDGLIVPVEATTEKLAIKQAEQSLGFQLCHCSKDVYLGLGGRLFRIFTADTMEQFAKVFQTVLPSLTPTPPRFELGRIVATPAALQVIEASGETPAYYLHLHGAGIWGNLDNHDRKANDAALVDGSRILSVYYLLDKTTIYIITEAVGDSGHRASTCIMLADEY